MRQWLVDPKILCQKHLGGEHVEHHMFVGTFKRKVSIKGYLNKNLLEPKSLLARHDALAERLKGHKSPLIITDELDYLSEEDRNTIIDKEAALAELIRRCPKCKENYERLKND